ncbi:MAG: hypothetical protein V3W41_12860 [Planctomycetota bacterium]
MGCDIHILFEKRELQGAPWRLFSPVVHCPRHSGTDKKCWQCDAAGSAYYANRNYHLFAILGNVRNAFGTAGCKTAAGAFRFISEHRGVPDDASPQLRSIANEEDFDAGYLGDHSLTHVSLKELVEFDWEQKNVLTGIISAEAFLEWDGKWPEAYSGGIFGPGIRVVDYFVPALLQAPERWLEAQGNPSHVCVSWPVTYRQAAGVAFMALVEALKAHGKPENVRMVFGFDS